MSEKTHTLVLQTQIEVQGVSQDQPCDVGEHQLSCQPVNPPEAVGCESRGCQQHCADRIIVLAAAMTIYRKSKCTTSM